jgi:hypothetical protein
MDKRLRGTGGQAASEYVALLALVAVALTLAAGLTSGGVGPRVLAGLQRGLCLVARPVCPVPTRVAADLEPCPLERSTRTEQVSEMIGLVRLGSSGTLSATRASDGGVTVTLADGSAAGGEMAVGARLRIGRRTFGGRVRADAAVRWTSGRAWRFPNVATAQHFVARFGDKATIAGKLLDEVRSTCSLLCDAVGWRPHPRLPEPDETYEEGGADAALAADLGEGPVFGTAGVAGGVILGRRLSRDGSRTWYLRLGAAATGGLALPFGGAGASGRTESVLSYRVDRHGLPIDLRVETSARAGAGGALRLQRQATAVRGGAGEAAVVELDATLDLRDPANLAAARVVLDAMLHPTRLAALPASAAQLGRRFAEHGELDRRTYVLSDAATGVGASAALGVELAGGFDRTTERLRLLTAETRLPGLPFLPRDDCRPA